MGKAAAGKRKDRQREIIESVRIDEAHRRIKEIVAAYRDTGEQVHEITDRIKENWVGRGRNEFESQYNLLVRKIDDFGEALLDIYDALVDAQAQYETADDKLRQEFVKALWS